MENYLYFAEPGAAFATTEAAMYPASSFIGCAPIDITSTRIYFKSQINDYDESAMVGDFVDVTHADTHDTAGSYHRFQIIAKAMAQAVNAGPHAGGAVIDIIDQKNGNYFGDIAGIIGDASFGIVITPDS